MEVITKDYAIALKRVKFFANGAQLEIIFGVVRHCNDDNYQLAIFLKD